MSMKNRVLVFIRVFRIFWRGLVISLQIHPFLKPVLEKKEAILFWKTGEFIE